MRCPHCDREITKLFVSPGHGRWTRVARVCGDMIDWQDRSTYDVVAKEGDKLYCQDSACERPFITFMGVFSTNLADLVMTSVL